MKKANPNDDGTPWPEQRAELLVCPHCGGRRRLLAAVTAPESIEKVAVVME